MGWLASSESILTAMEEDPLPLEASLIDDMLREHQVQFLVLCVSLIGIVKLQCQGTSFHYLINLWI